MSIYTTTTTVQQWYGSSVTVPAIKSSTFIPFATSCIGIAASLLDKKLNRQLSVGLSSEVDTAYADPDKNLVVISDKFLTGDFSAIGTEKSLTGSKTVGAILGILVHEIGHFAYSPKDLRGYAEFIQSHTTKEFDSGMALRISNTLEDIFIEFRIANLAPTLSWTLAEINKLMLTDAKFAERVKLLKRTNSVNSANRNLLLGYILFAKVTSDSGKVSAFSRDLFNLARSVTKLELLKDRFNLALRIYDIFADDKILFPTENPLNPQSQQNHEKSDNNDSENDNNGSENGDSENSESESENGESENDNNGSSQDLEPAKSDSENESQSDSNGESQNDSSDSENADSAGSNGSENESSEEPANVSNGSANEESELEEIQEINTFANRDKKPSIYSGLNLNPIQVKNSLDGHTIQEIILPVGENALEMDRRYIRLSEMAIQRTNANLAYGNQKSSGRNLRQLSRVVTDQKIFATKISTQTVKPLEVVILLDCSGSMVNSYAHGTTLTLLESACMATLGAATGLMNGKCMVSVYGHTADPTGKHKHLIIYKLMEYGESLSILAKRLYSLCHPRYGKLLNFYNRDGYAIQEISKKFLSRDKQKMLIVISDGQPNGSGTDYEDFRAQDHTKRVIDRLRVENIKVYSLSINTSAYTANNYIYGTENNTCSTDPNAIDSMIRQIFK